MDNSVLPMAVGESKLSPPFAADLGKKYWSGNNLYRLVKAASAIAAASQGLQLATALSAGAPTFAVALNVTTGNHLIVGAIPSTLTGAIAASAYFLALMEGQDSLATTSTAVGSITSSSILVAGSASDLVRVTTGVTAADIDDRTNMCAKGLIVSTATTTALAYQVNYRAPIR
jgi:hypothetical protein